MRLTKQGIKTHLDLHRHIQENFGTETKVTLGTHHSVQTHITSATTVWWQEWKPAEMNLANNNGWTAWALLES